VRRFSKSTEQHSIKKGRNSRFSWPKRRWKIYLDILTTYSSDEGSALVNGYDIIREQKSGATFYWLFTGAQSFVSGLVRARISTAFNADVYKVAKSRIEEVIH
jgi:ABC-2 type transport system ATP-binding protein